MGKKSAKQNTNPKVIRAEIVATSDGEVFEGSRGLHLACSSVKFFGLLCNVVMLYFVPRRRRELLDLLNDVQQNPMFVASLENSLAQYNTASYWHSLRVFGFGIAFWGMALARRKRTLLALNVAIAIAIFDFLRSLIQGKALGFWIHLTFLILDTVYLRQILRNRLEDPGTWYVQQLRKHLAYIQSLTAKNKWFGPRGLAADLNGETRS
jgi:hypothetical protein